jgi:hypothetical protein
VELRLILAGAMQMLIRLSLGLVLVMARGYALSETTPYLHAPSINTYARHDPSGVTVLPNGRFLKPAGHHFALAR